MPTWREAAETLSRRVTRRERVGAALAPMGVSLLTAGLLAGALKALGVSAWPEAVLVLGSVLGLVLAAVRSTRIREVEPADAAWALDRLAEARERGLAAATLEGPAGAEAAWAAGRLEPPQTRLVPPAGLALVLGGLLAVGVAAIVPRSGHDAADEAQGAVATAAQDDVGPTADGIAAREAQARREAERAEAGAAFREAVGLGPQAAADPRRVAERLKDPEALRAARDAVPEGSNLQELLADGAGSDAIAEALADAADAEERARKARRRAAADRAGGAFLTVPPERRAFLERYYARIGARAEMTRGGR